MSFTLVAFHAHPDDEALLTGGTLARAAAEGHRVVLVVATDGAAGLSGAAGRGAELAELRGRELRASADALGVAQVIDLGYGDSGDDGAHRGMRPSFSATPVADAAAALAAVLLQYHADCLLTYDVSGGYGHPDHQQVHRVGHAAARLAGTPLVLEATVDRDRLLRLMRALRWVPGLPSSFRPDAVADAYCPARRITHRVDVGAYLPAKRAAMQAHASQTTGDPAGRTLSVCLRLPAWLYRRAFRYEWFREPGAAAPGACDDIFARLR